MTLHMLPGIDRGFMRACTNVFLIRHPARVVASYSRKRERPTLADLGFVQQAELFDEVAARTGTAPVVVDSADIRADPAAALAALCRAVDIPFAPSMLRWPAGPNGLAGAWRRAPDCWTLRRTPGRKTWSGWGAWPSLRRSQR